MKTKALPLILLLYVQAFTAFGNTLYVDANSTSPDAPFGDWASAATGIQEAIDAAQDGDLILVTNGVYGWGGRTVYGALTNRVVIDKAVTVKSVNGPAVTFIVGDSRLGTEAVRCVYLTNNAVLSGFTLTNGATFKAVQGAGDEQLRVFNSGGGAWCENQTAVITNCVFVNNSADYGFGGRGGAVCSGTVRNSTLTGNKAVSGGGSFDSILIDCVLTNNRATSDGLLTAGASITSFGGAAYHGVLTNCTLSGNASESHGGGISSGTAEGCIIRENSANGDGGGLYDSTALNCTVAGNYAGGNGGGARSSTLINVNISGNVAKTGGGVSQGTVMNSKIADNVAFEDGGGAGNATIQNSALVNNSAVTNGGGAFLGRLVNCTVTGNSAKSGGGVSGAALTNCIVFYNQAVTGSNHFSGTLNFSCTTPLPETGTGNITATPVLADAFHLAAGSPCIGAGLGTVTVETDIDGQGWLNPPSIGCDEFQPDSMTGPLVVEVRRDYANARPSSPIQFSAVIEGRPSLSVWDFGDGTYATNEPYLDHSWPNTGVYAVTLTTFNADHPDGSTHAVSVHVMDEPVLYVNQLNTSPAVPFLSWLAAATNIQQAVDQAFSGGSIVIVSNGVYSTGGWGQSRLLSNRVALLKPVIVQSLNGPEFTHIEGSRSLEAPVRSAYLCDGAALIGFTLTNGSTMVGRPGNPREFAGGGAWCESTSATILNCIVVSNICQTWGAGIYSGTVKDTQIRHNVNRNGSLGGGGGVAWSAVFNSVISSNQTGLHGGGGAASSTLSNCLLLANTDGVANCTLFNCDVGDGSGPGMIGGTAFDSRIFNNRSSSLTVGGGATSATLSNCIVYANNAYRGGGVLDCVIFSCTLSNNFATNMGGGGFWAGLGFPANVSPGANNLIRDNASGSGGGGFAFFNAFHSLTNWSFIDNSTTGNGGGFLASTGFRTLYNCTFEGNMAGGHGGGVFADQTATAICIETSFLRNTAVTMAEVPSAQHCGPVTLLRIRRRTAEAFTARVPLIASSRITGPCKMAEACFSIPASVSATAPSRATQPKTAVDCTPRVDQCAIANSSRIPHKPTAADSMPHPR